MKTYILVKISKIFSSILKFFGKNATSFPGKIVLALKPNILKDLAKDYNVILVTGTNGKTQTTSFIKNIIENENNFVISNKEGANLIQGIVSLFLANYKKSNLKDKFAILEVDEATVKYVTEYVEPKAIVLTNVFIDQTERFSNIKITFKKIMEGIKKTKDTKIVINADCPVFLSERIENECIYYGFDIDNELFERYPNTDDCNCPMCNKPLTYNFTSYSNLGDFHCESCNFKRPKLNYSVDKIDNLGINEVTFDINQKTFSIKKGGIYNIYNALSAYSCVKIFDIDDKIIQDAFLSSEQIFGRQMSIMIENKEVIVYLMKNPTGANQLFKLIKFLNEPFTLIGILNNNLADGINYSWIDNADFESLKETSYSEVFLSGMKSNELKERFLKANFEEKELKIIENGPKSVLSTIKMAKEDKVIIITSYTSLASIENYLKDLKYM